MVSYDLNLCNNYYTGCYFYGSLLLFYIKITLVLKFKSLYTPIKVTKGKSISKDVVQFWAKKSEPTLS